MLQQNVLNPTFRLHQTQSWLNERFEIPLDVFLILSISFSSFKRLQHKLGFLAVFDFSKQLDQIPA